MTSHVKNIPFHEFHFHLVFLIPYVAIAKTILVRNLIFHSFRIEDSEQSHFIATIKTKQALFLKNIQHIFSFATLLEIFCLIKMFFFLFNLKSSFYSGKQNKKNDTGHSFFKVLDLVNILTLRWKSTKWNFFMSSVLRSDRLYNSIMYF